ncbi:phosphate ABC transporter substrate-binding protein PstS [Actimicrobium sp. CCI2.3]|uniref:phosphate ABC transporter substrate-binding protein PstS n=1 Tax=Actimicrobium sp. CCI2.3 TaxID=3048616 RepID=UPI002AB351BE|nr:phosphate ABC transporter substrate-binding protein PstS [Actimicrobium sp. CCI2.3]MDY7573162.1 phosphate ABC transporter substrate-binding protein PstS [Actimicrobium sp. CCI2.3]MEB0022141.1 phosphate ABC transporter substrate-binding protein PstS [Actimicrobium sp. CCI2.3]
MKNLLRLLVIILCMMRTGSTMAQGQQAEVRGAGSTFAAGAYTSWGSIYSKEKGVTVNYRATSSGDGIKQILAHAVDFGATDFALSPADLKKNDLIQIPTLVSGVVPVLNLSGVKAGQLKLTGPLLAAIFSRRISNWNDREIQLLNPAIKLPDVPIRCIVRSDESGTTAGFTDYLSKADTDWALRFGTGLRVNWPAGVVPAKGNDGMATTVSETAGAIGYVAANQAAKKKLVYSLLQNRSKNYVAPTEETLLAAVKSSPAPRDGEALNFVDMPASNAWPITDATYVLIERTPKNSARVAGVLRFFYWSFLRGDNMASETGYVPLPAMVQARAVGKLGQVRDAQGHPLDFMSSVWNTTLVRASGSPVISGKLGG